MNLRAEVFGATTNFMDKDYVERLPNIYELSLIDDEALYLDARSGGLPEPAGWQRQS